MHVKPANRANVRPPAGLGAAGVTRAIKDTTHEQGDDRDAVFTFELRAGTTIDAAPPERGGLDGQDYGEFV